jgi:hypothetical protein
MAVYGRSRCCSRPLYSSPLTWSGWPEVGSYSNSGSKADRRSLSGSVRGIADDSATGSAQVVTVHHRSLRDFNRYIVHAGKRL